MLKGIDPAIFYSGNCLPTVASLLQVAVVTDMAEDVVVEVDAAQVVLQLTLVVAIGGLSPAQFWMKLAAASSATFLDTSVSLWEFLVSCVACLAIFLFLKPLGLCAFDPGVGFFSS